MTNQSSMEERIAQVRRRMQQACDKAGRELSDVELVPISKKHPPESIRMAAACGLTLMGENRVQEAQAKIPLCPAHLRWHLVGHLQKNKAKPAAKLFSVIHSVDSLELLEMLDRFAAEHGRTLEVFLQLNVTGEMSKSGMVPEALLPTLQGATQCMNVDVIGLMTMPPFTEDPEEARPVFKALRELRDDAAAQSGFPLSSLSMGMSHDLEVAIEEGATHIRVGTDIFGQRPGTGATV